MAQTPLNQQISFSGFWLASTRVFTAIHACRLAMNAVNSHASQSRTKQKLPAPKWPSLTAEDKNHEAKTKVKCAYGKTNNALITVKSFIHGRESQLRFQEHHPSQTRPWKWQLTKSTALVLMHFTDQALHPAKHLSHTLPSLSLNKHRRADGHKHSQRGSEGPPDLPHPR